MTDRASPATRRQVRVLYTGGTFGMVPQNPNDPDSPLVPAPLAAFAAHLPGADSLSASADAAAGRVGHIDWQMEPLKDAAGMPLDPFESASVGPAEWSAMAAAAVRAAAVADAVVLVHGTDTLAFTASALSFLLIGLGVPVVITGAQRPLLQSGSDGAANFAAAIVAAGEGPAEVMVAFDGLLLRGNRTVKRSSSADRAFESPNFPPLGRFSRAMPPVLTLADTPPSARAPTAAQTGITRPDAAVALIAFYPGITSARLAQLLMTPDGRPLRGAVLECYGAGNIPQEPALGAVLQAASAAGTLLVAVTRCSHGPVVIGRYGASLMLRDAGVISGSDITSEAALAKLMVLLGRDSADTAQAKRDMARALAGEMTAHG